MRQYRAEKSWIVDDPRYVSAEKQEAQAKDPGTVTLDPLSPEEWIKLWRGDKPSRQLANTPAPPIEQRITECTGLRSEFGALGVEFGKAARDRRDQKLDQDRLRGKPEESERAPSVVEVATPIVSPDGREALVHVGVFLPGWGRVDILHLRRTKAGKWKTTGRLGVLIS
jgi:hypothetical protein